jgi:CubicO group peptidase (beta-lactamase class C family)
MKAVSVGLGSGLVFGALIFATSVSFSAQPVAPDASPSILAVPPELQALRREMLDPVFSGLTFHNMDELFTTRTVPHAGEPWAIPRSDHPLDFTYNFEGNSYTPEQFLDRTFTNALLVIKDGKIVTELYRNNTNERTRFIGWSMTKSITSILIGCALAEHRIKSIDDQITVYLPELKGGGYDGVTLRQVLEQRSGVLYDENPTVDNRNANLGTPLSSLIDYVKRYGDAAAAVKRASVPGTQFDYKTLNTVVLGMIIERVSGGSTISAYTTQRLWEPLGAEADGFFIMDGPPGVGREFNGAGFNATLRDYARIGLMMLNQGRANGHQIVPAQWVAESTGARTSFTSDPKAAHQSPRSPLVSDLVGGYGYQWWTYANSDAYTALGLGGQFIFVDPATRTVIVKMSYFPPGPKSMAAEHETGAFLEAASAWTPR